jgi:Kef-type K+ transport system membrane component KefB
MNENLFSALSLAIVIATVMALIMRLIRQPLIIGHIITGVIIGPSLLHLLKSPDTITTFSNIGIALLLFIIGLGLNPNVIKEIGRVASFIGIVQVFIVSVLGSWFGSLLGLNYKDSLFFGVSLAFSSTIIILKLLSDKKEQGRLYGKLTIGVLIVQDIFAAIALLFVTSQGKNNIISIHSLVLLAIKGILASLAILIVGNVFLPKVQKFISSSQEFLFLFAIGWGFGCAALFSGIGFSIEIGALIGGVALASLPFTQEISSRLRPLRDFFVVVFFISLGSRLTFHSIGSEVSLLIVGGLVVVVLKPLIVMITMGLLGYTKQTTFKTAVSLGQVSEFSLVLILLGNQAGIVPISLVNVITVIALASIAVSTYFINYSEPIFRSIEKELSLFEKTNHDLSLEKGLRHYDLVLFGYKKGGHEFIKLFQSLHKRFVVIDFDPEAIEQMEQQGINCIFGDATDIELLQEVGIDKAHLIVSMISDHEANVFLLKLVEKINPKAIVVVHAESVHKANDLYAIGASYVVIPHYIGTEKIGSFIRKSGLRKSEFVKYHEKHLAYLKDHYALESDK